MARILVLHGVPTARARLEQALRDAPIRLTEHPIETAHAWHDLETRILRWPDGIVVFDPYFDGDFAERVVHRLVSAFSGLQAFVAYSDWRREVTRDVLALGRWGVRDIVTLDVDDGPRQLANVLARVWRESGVWRSVAPYVGAVAPEVREAVEIALATPRGLTVRGLARHMSITPRTLQRHFESADLPTPQTVVSRCRLLHAARLLSIPQISSDRVASALLYSDAASLRRAFTRHYDVTLSDVRAPGTVNLLAARLLRTPRSTRPPVTFVHSDLTPGPRRTRRPSAGWDLVAVQGD